MSSSVLVQEIARVQKDVESDTPGARSRLIELARELATSLETPSETVMRVGWAEPATFACLRTAADLDIFERLRESKKPLSSAEIATAVGAKAGLIARIMKHLAATNVVTEEGPDRYCRNLLTDALTEPRFREGIIYCHDVAGPSFHQMPTYFKSTDYVMPTALDNGPFQYAHGTKAPFFVWLGQNPTYLANFSNYMTGYRAGKPTWTSFYPVRQRLVDSTSADDSVLLVDVGGGIGHDLEEFQARFPDIKGRLILQEQPDVVAQISRLSPGIEATEHDFFTAQPLKGAKAYYLHSVLHDWDDATCLRILSNLQPAMRAGHSKLLINELIVPDSKASWSATSMDWLMLALGAVRERTEADWRSLLKEAGFEVEQIWTFEQGTESLIEATLGA